MSAKAERVGRKRAYGVKAGVTLNANTPTVLDAGYLTAVTDGSGAALSAGVTTFEVDNSAGSNGSIIAEVVSGEHKFTNSGDIAVTDVGATAYFVNDSTLSIDHATNTLNAAGKIIQVDGDGVWVALGQ
ncbi:hypothetical protein SAMN03080615_00880 [Amphritea atlantica]|uniref:Bacteriophage lambda head decoration protein D n=1 Tax=Amphritea atlantica TaxID=355243 RepID=A0A1H9EFW9_9GAMM|nr:hypothetical protein [Amphritea atlantica]SEQ24620.1 hypothetical protein SAMN03080615_00880 [Amphritea atlantica]